MQRLKLLKLMLIGFLAMLAGGAFGCMEELYECTSNADCPTGNECVVYFSGGTGRHSSSYCMSLGFDVGTRDQASSQDLGTSDTREMDSGGDPGLGLGMDTGSEAEYDSGTWFDSVSGLTWENPPDFGVRTWDEAKSYCAVLSLAGGGWRLPTIEELRSLIRGCGATQAGGSCGVRDSCLSWDGCRDSSCDGCPFGAGPAAGCYWLDDIGGSCEWYWSSSPTADRYGGAFGVRFVNGRVSYGSIDYDFHVRCVR